MDTRIFLTKVTERAQNADFRRFTSSSGNPSIWRAQDTAENRRISQKTEADSPLLLEIQAFGGRRYWNWVGLFYLRLGLFAYGWSWLLTVNSVWSFLFMVEIVFVFFGCGGKSV